MGKLGLAYGMDDGIVGGALGGSPAGQPARVSAEPLPAAAGEGNVVRLAVCA